MPVDRHGAGPGPQLLAPVACRSSLLSPGRLARRTACQRRLPSRSRPRRRGDECGALARSPSCFLPEASAPHRAGNRPTRPAPPSRPAADRPPGSSVCGCGWPLTARLTSRITGPDRPKCAKRSEPRRLARGCRLSLQQHTDGNVGQRDAARSRDPGDIRSSKEPGPDAAVRCDGLLLDGDSGSRRRLVPRLGVGLAAGRQDHLLGLQGVRRACRQKKVARARASSSTTGSSRASGWRRCGAGGSGEGVEHIDGPVADRGRFCPSPRPWWRRLRL